MCVYRTMDLAIYAILRGKERCLEDWKRIAAMVDDNFRVENVHAEDHGAFGIVEFVLA